MARGVDSRLRGNDESVERRCLANGATTQARHGSVRTRAIYKSQALKILLTNSRSMLGYTAGLCGGGCLVLPSAGPSPDRWTGRQGLSLWLNFFGWSEQ
jgi:hypothetical protein